MNLLKSKISVKEYLHDYKQPIYHVLEHYVIKTIFLILYLPTSTHFFLRSTMCFITSRLKLKYDKHPNTRAERIKEI